MGKYKQRLVKLHHSTVTFAGIALWLVPPASEAIKLKQLMRMPPSLEPLPYALPSFEPHITIASFPLAVSPESLRSALNNDSQVHAKPLHVAFTALTADDTFFRSVIIDVAPTPALAALREQVQQALPEYEARSPRFPHVSLFYVPDEFAADREKIRDAVWSAHGVRLTNSGDGGSQASAERVVFDLSGTDEEHCLAGFDASEVWIVRCEGAVEDWTVLDKINLVCHSE